MEAHDPPAIWKRRPVETWDSVSNIPLLMKMILMLSLVQQTIPFKKVVARVSRLWRHTVGSMWHQGERAVEVAIRDAALLDRWLLTVVSSAPGLWGLRLKRCVNPVALRQDALMPSHGEWPWGFRWGHTLPLHEEDEEDEDQVEHTLPLGCRHLGALRDIPKWLSTYVFELTEGTSKPQLLHMQLAHVYAQAFPDQIIFMHEISQARRHCILPSELVVIEWLLRAVVSSMMTTLHDLGQGIDPNGLIDETSPVEWFDNHGYSFKPLQGEVFGPRWMSRGQGLAAPHKVPDSFVPDSPFSQTVERFIQNVLAATRVDILTTHFSTVDLRLECGLQCGLISGPIWLHYIEAVQGDYPDMPFLVPISRYIRKALFAPERRMEWLQRDIEALCSSDTHGEYCGVDALENTACIHWRLLHDQYRLLQDFKIPVDAGELGEDSSTCSSTSGSDSESNSESESDY